MRLKRKELYFEYHEAMGIVGKFWIASLNAGGCRGLRDVLTISPNCVMTAGVEL